MYLFQHLLMETPHWHPMACILPYINNTPNMFHYQCGWLGLAAGHRQKGGGREEVWGSSSDARVTPWHTAGTQQVFVEWMKDLSNGFYYTGNKGSQNIDTKWHIDFKILFGKNSKICLGPKWKEKKKMCVSIKGPIPREEGGQSQVSACEASIFYRCGFLPHGKINTRAEHRQFQVTAKGKG